MESLEVIYMFLIQGLIIQGLTTSNSQTSLQHIRNELFGDP